MGVNTLQLNIIVTLCIIQLAHCHSSDYLQVLRNLFNCIYCCTTSTLSALRNILTNSIKTQIPNLQCCKAINFTARTYTSIEGIGFTSQIKRNLYKRNSNILR